MQSRSALLALVLLLTSIACGQQGFPKNAPLLKSPRTKRLVEMDSEKTPVAWRRLVNSILTDPRSTAMERYAAHLSLAMTGMGKKPTNEIVRELKLASALFPKTGLPKDYWLQELLVKQTGPLLDSLPQEPLTVELAPEPVLRAAKVDPAAMKELIEEGRKSHSESLIVWKDGKVLLRAHRGIESPTMLASGTKSISSFPIMFLMDEGRIQSVDQPLSDFFPEWRNIPASAPITVRRRAWITLRHVLSHTSGMETEFSDGHIPEQKSAVKYALSSPIVTDPGTVYNYNNRAANLIAGVVRRLTGVPIQMYLERRLFKPLGISAYYWHRDLAGDGHVYGGLSLTASDLLKISRFVLNEGVWNGKRLVSADRIRQFTQTSSQSRKVESGLMWWMEFDGFLYRLNQDQIDQWRKEGASAETLADLNKKKGEWLPSYYFQELFRQQFRTESEFEAWFQKSDWSKLPYKPDGPPNMIYSSGSLGQFLVIIPGKNLVAVRQIHPLRYKVDADTFGDFTGRVQKLILDKD